MLEVNSSEYELKEITKIRRELHKIPESGFKEHKTSKYIKKYLLSFGYEINEVAGTGIIAVKKSADENNTKDAIAFRADIDALPLKEETGVDFASTHEGNMHACGHDGHTAMLLRFAAFISRQHDIKKNIIFIFQPAEEILAGAKEIINSDVLKSFNVEAVLGTHLFPSFEEGKIAIKSGTAMAQNTVADISINGKSAHGASPHLGIDAIVLAASLITSYQNIVSRTIDPNKPAVLTVGTIKGGDAPNIIAEKVKLGCCIRTYEEEVGNKIVEAMEKKHAALELETGAKIKMDFKTYPAVVNDKNLFDKVSKGLGKDKFMLMENPIPASEDFSYYSKIAPSLFMFLGTRNEEKGYIHPLHSNKFNFDENVLVSGVENDINIASELGALKINYVNGIRSFLEKTLRRCKKVVKNELLKRGLEDNVENRKNIGIEVCLTNIHSEDREDVNEELKKFLKDNNADYELNTTTKIINKEDLQNLNGITSSHIVELFIDGKQALNDLYTICEETKEHIFLASQNEKKQEQISYGL